VTTAARQLGVWPEIIGEQIAYRELLFQMIRRDLLIRYKQTAMGFGWAVFMPLVNTAVFAIIFTRVAPIDVGMPYPLFAFTGLLLWNFFAAALRFSVTSLTGNPSLVTKVYFPREIFPFSAVVVSLVDTIVASALLVALLTYYQIGFGWSILFLPFVLAVLVMFTTAIALFLAMANLFYRDVKYLFEIVISVWMFATSVVYPLDRLDGRLGAVLALNPMTHCIDAFRAIVIEHHAPSPMFATTALVVAGMLAGAWLLFHRAEYDFAENL
jgi:ABC-type polysaccharide/polyol phosphate export permease